MNSKEADLCPSQFGKVELRLHCRGEETPDFRTSFLVLESACFKWYDDREKNICKGVAYIMNKVEIIKDSSNDEKKKILQCQVSIERGPALFEVRVAHGSKIWQLAIDTHFSRCFRPLHLLPAYAYDLDDARYTSLHLSTIAKVSLNNGAAFDIPVSILDDVEEKVNILFPQSRTMSADARMQITASVMKAQNQMVLEVLRRHHHLEIADQQLQRALTKMTERATIAEAHAESLHATILQIEEILPQLSHSVGDRVAADATTGVEDTDARCQSGANTPTSHNSTGLGTISWRRKFEAAEQELKRVLEQLHSTQRHLHEQQHLPAFQSRIDALTKENLMLREMAVMLRAQIVALNDQLHEIQQAALAQIETLHVQNPELAEAAATSLRKMYDEPHQPGTNSSQEGGTKIAFESKSDSPSVNRAIKIDLSQFLSAKASDPSEKYPVSPSIFRQPLNLDDYSASSDPSLIPKYPVKVVNIATLVDEYERESKQDEGTDELVTFPLLEQGNWTNKYQDYIDQLQHSKSSSLGSSSSATGLLPEIVTSLGWSFVEERFVMQLYQHYLHLGNVPGSAFSHVHGISLTKFQKFVKDFHILTLHSSPTATVGSDHHNKSAFTTAYVTGQPLPHSGTSAQQANSSGASSPLLDKFLSHSEVSAIFTVASSTNVQEEPGQQRLGALWTQLQGQFSNTYSSSSSSSSSSSTTALNNSQSSSQQTSVPTKAAFRVHGGHRSAAEVLDFYHTQHTIYPMHSSTDQAAGSSNSSAALRDSAASAGAAFSVGHPGGTGITVGVVNPASAVLSLAQFRYALTLIAEKLYARVLQQAMGGIAPQTLTGKDRIQAVRAMLELFWIKNIVPMALSFDLVPQSLSSLRIFLVHVQSESTRLMKAVRAPKQGYQEMIPELFAFFYHQHQLQQQANANTNSTSFAMLAQLCHAPHLQLLCRLFRTYAATSSSSGNKAVAGQDLLEMTAPVNELIGLEYLLHPLNHIPTLSMPFTKFRRFCLAKGLVPYLIGEHQVYALYQECVVMIQMYLTIFPFDSSSAQNGGQSSNHNSTTNGPKKKSKKRASESWIPVRSFWEEKRVFPHVCFPEWMLILLADADKEAVQLLQWQESETTHWKQSSSTKAKSSSRATSPAHFSRPTSLDNHQNLHSKNAAADGSNMVTSGLDLMGFVLLIGSLAMKVFPHVPPVSRVTQLFALLLQNPVNRVDSAPASDLDGNVMVGEGFNLGGVFHHHT